MCPVGLSRPTGLQRIPNTNPALKCRAIGNAAPRLPSPFACENICPSISGGEFMLFAKRLREGVIRGDITCSVRIWMRPRVTEGRRYRIGDGEIEIDSITPIGFPDITPELARES